MIIASLNIFVSLYFAVFRLPHPYTGFTAIHPINGSAVQKMPPSAAGPVFVHQPLASSSTSPIKPLGQNSICSILDLPPAAATAAGILAMLPPTAYSPNLFASAPPPPPHPPLTSMVNYLTQVIYDPYQTEKIKIIFCKGKNLHFRMMFTPLPLIMSDLVIIFKTLKVKDT